MNKTIKDVKIEIGARCYMCMQELKQAKNMQDVYKAYYRFDGALNALQVISYPCNRDEFHELTEKVAECRKRVDDYIRDNIGGDIYLDILCN